MHRRLPILLLTMILGLMTLRVEVSDPDTYTWGFEVATIEGRGVVARL